MKARNVVSAERRLLTTRPLNGDVKPCRACGSRAEFHEHQQVDGYLVPAWICEVPGCQAEIVRLTAIQAASSQGLIRDAKALQARARRAAMMSRARADRTRERVTQSQARLKPKK